VYGNRGYCAMSFTGFFYARDEKQRTDRKLPYLTHLSLLSRGSLVGCLETCCARSSFTVGTLRQGTKRRRVANPRFCYMLCFEGQVLTT
jgi:hypothetical protein